MLEFLEIAHKDFEKRQVEFVRNLEEESKLLSIEEKDDFMDFYSTDYWKLHEVHPYLLYSSFLVSWYSLVERELYGLCDFYCSQTDDLLRYKDLAGQGIRRAQLFFKKVAKIDMEEEQWNELTQRAGKIRNCIVHRGGELLDDEIKQLREYLIKFNLLDKERLVLNFDYCKYLIDFSARFFEKLWEKTIPGSTKRKLVV